MIAPEASNFELLALFTLEIHFSNDFSYMHTGTLLQKLDPISRFSSFCNFYNSIKFVLFYIETVIDFMVLICNHIWCRILPCWKKILYPGNKLIPFVS